MWKYLVCVFASALVAMVTPSHAAPDPARVAALVADLKAQGKDPIAFVVQALEKGELVVFDEGLHSAVEPWRFYASLVADQRFSSRARLIFLEVIPFNQQRHLDAYLSSPTNTPSLLWPALQSSLATGWYFQTYIDFLSAVWTANQSLPKERRIRVIGVSPPAYWPLIDSHEEFARYRRDGFAGFDHEMYARIRMHLNEFDGSERGIFLTNTRHAYTGLKKPGGEYFWNAGTYLRQWNPGHSISVRFNAPFLEVKSAGAERGPTLGSMAKGAVYGWTRANGGAWDAAFAAGGDAPVAVSLTGTAFASTPYVGNQMLVAAPGQTMADVYDAVIHLKRLEDWHETARSSQIYTEEFRQELMRRLTFVYPGEELAAVMKSEGAKTLVELVDMIAAPVPEAPLKEAQSLPPLN